MKPAKLPYLNVHTKVPLKFCKTLIRKDGQPLCTQFYPSFPRRHHSLSTKPEHQPMYCTQTLARFPQRFPQHKS